MKVLLAGATGAIGSPLISKLLADGHAVLGITQSAERAADLKAKGAEAVVADVLDAASVSDAVSRVRPVAIINELTSLPKHYTPEEMKAATPRDAEVRIKGNANLLAAARASNCRRYILQSAAFWYAPGAGPADENEPFAFDASPGIAAGCRRYADLEAAILAQREIEGVLLRYGFFYGPGTWFTKDGDVGHQVRQRQVPIIGAGQGVWNWIHIEDAASATVSALQAAPGAYNVVDDQPSEQRVWLPAFARYAGAPEPAQISEDDALRQAGSDSVYYATRLRAASNAKAKRELHFKPRPLEWLSA
ncbi:MAG: NAD(P)-dependent oxidoreductase [Bryobacteraceae bacterium]